MAKRPPLMKGQIYRYKAIAEYHYEPDKTIKYETTGFCIVKKIDIHDCIHTLDYIEHRKYVNDCEDETFNAASIYYGGYSSKNSFYSHFNNHGGHLTERYLVTNEEEKEELIQLIIGNIRDMVTIDETRTL